MSVRFDAASDRLLRTSDLPSYNSAYTFDAWVYLVGTTGNAQTILGIDTNVDGANEDSLYIATGGGALSLFVATASATTDINGSANVTVGAWHHVAVVRESATSLKAYLDGTLVATNTRNVGGRSTAPTRMEIGGSYTANSYRFNGRVANVRIWTVALTATQVAEQSALYTPSITTGLHLWTPLPGHTDLADDSGNGRNWTAGGTLTTEGDPPVGPPSAHDLTATGVTTGAPALGAPALGQAHALSATGAAAGGPSLGAPALGQAHALTAAAAGAAGAPALGSPSLAQQHALGATGIAAGAPLLGAPALASGSYRLTDDAGSPLTTEAGAYLWSAEPPASGAHDLTATGLTTGAPALGAPALGQIHALAATGVVAGAPALGTPALGQMHALTATGAAVGAPVLGAPTLGQSHALTAAGITAGAPIAGAPALGQAHALTATGVATGAPLLGSPSLGEGVGLVAEGIAAGAPVAGSPALGQHHILGTNAVEAGAPVLGMPALVQVHDLIAEGLVAGAPVLGLPALTSGGVIVRRRLTLPGRPLALTLSERPTALTLPGRPLALTLPLPEEVFM